MIAETLRTWLLGVIAAGIIVGILYALLPRGRMKAVAHTVGGMALMLVIVRPLLGLDLTELALRYEDYQQQIQALTEEYRRSGDAEFAALIADKTAAYIASKGDDLGITCTPRVEMEDRDGVPWPSAVTLDIPKDEALSAWLSTELAIDDAHQYCKGGRGFRRRRGRMRGRGLARGHWRADVRRAGKPDCARRICHSGGQGRGVRRRLCRRTAARQRT